MKDDSKNIELSLYHLQSEIRRLKIELIKQEINEKIFNLKLIQDGKINGTMNELNLKLNSSILTTTIKTTISSAVAEEDKPFGSILFTNIIGPLQIWHLILILFFVWIIICKTFFFLFVMV
jgi:hypothetical protein